MWLKFRKQSLSTTFCASFPTKKLSIHYSARIGIYRAHHDYARREIVTRWRVLVTASISSLSSSRSADCLALEQNSLQTVCAEDNLFTPVSLNGRFMHGFIVNFLSVWLVGRLTSWLVVGWILSGGETSVVLGARCTGPCYCLVVSKSEKRAIVCIISLIPPYKDATSVLLMVE